MATATLIIDSYHSRCSACRKNADPGEYSHDMQTMEGEGCGATFTAMLSVYGEKEACLKMRPDLPYVGYDKKDLP